MCTQVWHATHKRAGLEKFMHELGIIVHVAKTLKHVALQENVSKIGSVTL